MIFARSCDVPRKQVLLIAVNSGTEHVHIEVERLGDLGLHPGYDTRILWGDGADCGPGMHVWCTCTRVPASHAC